MNKHDITFLSEDSATINGKTVYKDANDNWISSIAMTDDEKVAFNNALNKRTSKAS